MAEVMGEGNRFREIFIQAKGAGDVPGDRRHFDGVGQPGAQMVAAAIEENLGFVFEATESA